MKQIIISRDEIIRNIIDSFFKGIDYFDEPEIGHIWIAKHGIKRYNRFDTPLAKEKGLVPPSVMSIDKNDSTKGRIAEFETLTVEPKEGGQYEIAVRIWSESQWRGYKINDFDDEHYLVGINTRGH